MPAWAVAWSVAARPASYADSGTIGAAHLHPVPRDCLTGRHSCFEGLSATAAEQRDLLVPPKRPFFRSTFLTG